MQIGMDQTAEWILLWYGEIDWREYFGMRFAYPHPRGLLQHWRTLEEPVMPVIERANTEKEALREALKAMYVCFNNRILGSGANPSEDLAFRDQCIDACEDARVALRVTTP